MQKLIKRVLLILLHIHSYHCFSQRNNFGLLYGQVKHNEKETPIPYASVILKNNEQQIINGTTTLEDGSFTLQNIAYGEYNVEFQIMGYSSVSQKIILSSKTPKLNLKTIFLKETSTLLNTIEVRAEETSIIQKIDKKIINVGKDLVATGTNSLQMLQNIPYIDVNLQNGSISLRGNENVRVQINGKPSNMNTAQLLKQTPSFLIKQIEIITSPSSKYNPEGMSGIINFILKKNTQSGFNGTVSAGIEHSKNTRPDANLNLNYNIGKANFYASYSYSSGKNNTILNMERTDKILSQYFDFLHDYVDNAYKIGADIYLNKNNTLSFYTYQNSSNSDLNTTSFIQVGNAKLNTPNLSIYEESEQIYNMDYKIDLNNNKSIELEANYSIHKNPETSINKLIESPTSKLFNYTNNITDTRKSWLINLDYTTPIFKDGELELGLEYRDQQSYNSIITTEHVETGTPPVLTPKGNTQFNYDRKMYSAYCSFSNSFEKLSIQAGVRLEQYTANGVFSNTQQNNIPKYSDKIFSVYPSAYITYHLPNKDDIQLAYSRRVDRPAIHQVSPIQEWVSPYTTSEGNQFLVPQFTNSIELNYSKAIQRGTITFGTFYRRISNRIGRIIFRDDVNPDKQTLSYGNYSTANSYGAEIFANHKPFKWWTISPRIEAYVQDSYGVVNGTEKQVKNTLFKSSFNNNFKISKTIRLQLTSIYRGESKNVQFTIKPYASVNIGASMNLFNDKGTLTLRGTDIFNKINYEFSSDDSPYLQNGKYNLEYNSVYIGFAYNFGGGKTNKRSRKYRETNETQGGLF
ncbi:outer membrane beta-barrel protein [Tenacibaculum sp. 190524A02b]|uniref:Outer membrane receptor for ferrienterochelin and colicins n=1 Tax=Tenacibaculum vairaonense TaxID=3137860 RepID=A0ABM9PHZ6_9FLAO